MTAPRPYRNPLDEPPRWPLFAMLALAGAGIVAIACAVVSEVAR